MLRVFLLAGLAMSAVAADVDSGLDAIGAAKTFGGEVPSADGEGFNAAGWVRLRGVAAPGGESEEARAKGPAAVSETREALRILRDRALKTCVLIRWPADWRKVYLPQDLREAYENGRKLGAAYGDLADAWEIDNEPDLGFVPESAERYTAFLKATYLGIKAGSMEHGAGTQTQVSGLRSQVSPFVLMGSLGLPPGLWLERFAANGGFSYTDGFNYHYYGYAEDFTAVYRAHEDAVKQLGVRSYALNGIKTSNPERLTSNIRQKDLPIFLTEIGYGMLGKVARDTKEGRLRQWRWFQSVGEQANELRIEAPMAFYLQPYLEYDINEYGLTVPAKPAHGLDVKGDRVDGKSGSWTAGGITYVPEDFGATEPQRWMRQIGSPIAGNDATPALAQWMGLRKTSGLRSQVSGFSIASKSWTVAVAQPSPVVIDFLNGEGLSFVKRYNGSFVTGLHPVTVKKPETGQRLGEDGEAKLKPEEARLKSQTPDTKPQALPVRAEEFILHVRTVNGNLYEVYPTRQAKEEWQTYLEPQGNFTMSFYGRAELPWRFAENKPASLVIVMYPKRLPAVYEFRRPQLIKFEAQPKEVGRVIPNAPQSHPDGDLGTSRPINSQEPGANVRYGRGKIVLYNFSDKAVTGKLVLPQGIGRVIPNAPGSAPQGGDLGTSRPASEESTLVLEVGERREVEVAIQVPWRRFESIDAPIAFVPEDQAIPPARFVTVFLPDIAGMKREVTASLLPEQETGNRGPGTNYAFVGSRKRATEEAPMSAQSAEGQGQSGTGQTLGASPLPLTAFAQQGARVEPTGDGFMVTVTETPPGKPQRIEAEIPWPDGLRFGKDEFLSLEYRLKP